MIAHPFELQLITSKLKCLHSSPPLHLHHTFWKACSMIAKLSTEFIGKLWTADVPTMSIFATYTFSASDILHAGLLFQRKIQLRWGWIPQHHRLWQCWYTHTQPRYLKQIDCNAVTAGPNIASSYSWWNIRCLLSSKCPAKPRVCMCVMSGSWNNTTQRKHTQTQTNMHAEGKLWHD